LSVLQITILQGFSQVELADSLFAEMQGFSQVELADSLFAEMHK
jgi:hypothetical protein